MTKRQILIVEDNTIEARNIQKTLKRLGYAISAVASSGNGAIQKVEETLPDLVLMDIKLDGKMDGIKAAEQIRAHFDIPVVYLTAYANEGLLQRAKITEPFGYILKPFLDRELHTNIEIALYKHKMEKKLRESEVRYREDLEKQIEERTSELRQTNEQLQKEIIQRKGAEKLLQKSEERFRAISEIVSDYAYVLRVEPNGWLVRCRVISICSLTHSGGALPDPIIPSPPASETAAASSVVATWAIPP